MQSVRTQPKGMDTDEVRKVSFWISNIFIVLATIMGVYLAASQGFKQAIIFDNIQSDKKNYYLRKSLQNELESNVDIIDEYLNKIRQGAFPSELSLVMNTFVWEAMRFSSTTLEVSPEILGPVQTFYTQVPSIRGRILNQQANTLSTAQGARRIQEQVDIVKEKVIPALEADMATIAERLKKHDIDI